MPKMAGNNFAGIQLRHNDNVTTIAAMTNTENSAMKRSQPIHYNCSSHFLHHELKLDNSDLKYELAPRTPSLFDDISIRNSTMAILATLLDSMVPNENNLPDGALFVEMLDIFFMLQHGHARQHTMKYVARTLRMS